MKKIGLALVLLVSLPTFAGQMKEIYTMTVDSVYSTLGLDENYVEIESTRFVHIEGSDLAIRTIVVDKYDTEKFDCITLFKKVDTDYEVSQTKCVVYK